MKTLMNIIHPTLALFVLACFTFPPTSRAKSPNNLGNLNTAFGTGALFSVTTGGANTAVGFNCMFNDTDGTGNTAVGADTMQLGTSGTNSTAIGTQALTHNDADGNTGIGVSALFTNVSGTGNTATGAVALNQNVSGNYNTADGSGALFNNTGSQNTGVGYNAMVQKTGGNGNIAMGYLAGFNLTTGDNNIDIGNQGLAGDSNTIRIGDTTNGSTQTFIAGIGTSPVTGVSVVVGTGTAAGQLGVAPSSQRFKDSIKPMDKASEAILALKPVTFRYKKQIDPDGTPQFGLVAEEVAKINPDLVVRDKEAKPYTVRYEAVNAMLLNEFLKEHQKVQRLEAALAAVNERLKAQDAKIDKVNAKVELTKPAPQMVNNNQ